MLRSLALIQAHQQTCMVIFSHSNYVHIDSWADRKIFCSFYWKVNIPCTHLQSRMAPWMIYNSWSKTHKPHLFFGVFACFWRGYAVACTLWFWKQCCKTKVYAEYRQVSYSGVEKAWRRDTAAMLCGLRKEGRNGECRHL